MGLITELIAVAHLTGLLYGIISSKTLILSEILSSKYMTFSLKYKRKAMEEWVIRAE